MDFKWLDLFEKLKLNADDFRAWLRSQGLQAVPGCSICSGSMNILPQDDVWICHKRACRKNEETKPYLSVRQGGSFANSKLPESTIFATAYVWLKLDPSEKVILAWRDCEDANLMGASFEEHLLSVL
ncbi:unnamed protein product [Haemonchus placei]|uniref:Zf-RVT domain-containing protein n=1 Tax=Haemonchus placei TaxID=6290 RepID=A0A0N4W027_HAEPC|nr:unnamed protein product [Haemonchus placei]